MSAPSTCDLAGARAVSASPSLAVGTSGWCISLSGGRRSLSLWRADSVRRAVVPVVVDGPVARSRPSVARLSA